MVGTRQFARAVPDAVQAEQILEGSVEAALHLARTPSPKLGRSERLSPDLDILSDRLAVRGGEFCRGLAVALRERGVTRAVYGY